LSFLGIAFGAGFLELLVLLFLEILTSLKALKSPTFFLRLFCSCAFIKAFKESLSGFIFYFVAKR
jgi:hypothetical protein